MVNRHSSRATAARLRRTLQPNSASLSNDDGHDNSPVWIVEHESNFAAVEFSQLDSEKKTALDCLDALYEPCDVLETGRLLCMRGLPVPIVNKTLHMSRMHLECHRQEIHLADCYGHAPLDREFLNYIIPCDVNIDPLELQQPVCLVIKCVSHDQGWASDATHLNHTYQGCHSWIEFDVSNPSGVPVLPRTVACLNLRASLDARRHVNYITQPQMLEHLRPGNQVKLHMRAQYPGWANYVTYARVSIVSAAGIKEDDEFQNLQDRV